jgi:hypothetical protein
MHFPVVMKMMEKMTALAAPPPMLDHHHRRRRQKLNCQTISKSSTIMEGVAATARNIPPR